MSKYHAGDAIGTKCWVKEKYDNNTNNNDYDNDNNNNSK